MAWLLAGTAGRRFCGFRPVNTHFALKGAFMSSKKESLLVVLKCIAYTVVSAVVVFLVGKRTGWL
ncbi:MAG: hypothetical protein HDR51_03150 [Treponema sp.]|nr:hypothetical protein [Treponema sp.]